jgi:hypothetical protein
VPIHIHVHIHNPQGDLIMASIAELQAKVDALVQAEADREARDVAQDAATTAQIAMLQQSIADLNAIIASGGLSPENQALLDSMATKLDAVVASLNAADPTPPVV